MLGINPFDQPDVEAAKQAATVLEQRMPTFRSSLEFVLSTVKPGDYIAIQAFIDTESPDIDALQRARGAARPAPRGHYAGIGLRYLHSTGQLHGRRAERRISADRR